MKRQFLTIYEHGSSLKNGQTLSIQGGQPCITLDKELRITLMVIV